MENVGKCLQIFAESVHIIIYFSAMLLKYKKICWIIVISIVTRDYQFETQPSTNSIKQN